MSTVVVTNKGEGPYSRKFDGKLYSFAPDDPVTIPEVAAAYLFGYGGGEEARRKIVVRNGWEKNGMPDDPFGPAAAQKRLAEFVFRKGPEGKASAKPEKKIAPSHQGREMTGVNAIGPNHKEDGKTILPRSALRLPGSTVPLAPPAA